MATRLIVGRARTRLFVTSQQMKRLCVGYRELSNMSDEVLFEAVGSTRIITLNRPKALNALNLNMVEKIIPSLQDWIAPDSKVSMIILKGAGEKAFCAGGDVRAVTEEGRKDPKSLNATHFFRREYVLDHLIGSCPIPFIALIDGITMGGGVGLSVHAPFKVATEKTLFAMPETAIGLFPDVGGSHFLTRLNGALGMYLALTGARLKGEHVYKAGIASHYVPHKDGMFEKMTAELLTLSNPTPDSIQDLLASFHNQSCTDEPFSLSDQKQQIDYVFGLSTLEQIFSALEADHSDWAANTLKTLKKMSPTSMKVTMEQLRRGAQMSLADCLKMELRICRMTMMNNDFYEGVRAVLVDKDNQPNWRPATLEATTDEYVQTYFHPMPDGQELEL
ncbi:3-hydroxyisobutyryl-CoA hydrolase, mitochondrial-like [Watersipora subatra]|uniref:3-hydroxyisobutyryl-CoA hydrolase, mitochondrial-like n=1 Tax=Watersipora subatra TaxID=2589382 RepID=UPI00355BE927